MNRFTSLLLPLDTSPEAAKGAECALWLSKALGATLHVLHASTQLLSGREGLSLLHFPGAQQSCVVLHQLPSNTEAAVLEAITTYDVDLVVMSAYGEPVKAGFKLSQCLGIIAQAVIERSPVPVLLFPLRYRQVLPWTSMLAAASGEIASDQALETAAHLAAVLKLKVTPVHAGDGSGSANTMPLNVYADASHHEYPLRIREMIERGLTHCSAEECDYVDQVLLLQGEPAQALLDHAARHAYSVLALGCHGELGAGRALVLKHLLEQAECALLLVRKTEAPTARLKVGEGGDV